MTICTNCGKENGPAASFCADCGAPLAVAGTKRAKREVPCKGLKTAAFAVLLADLVLFTLLFFGLVARDQAYSMYILRFAAIVPATVHAWGVRTGEHELDVFFAAVTLLFVNQVAGLLLALALYSERKAGKRASSMKGADE